MRFAPSHEWILVQGNTGTVGISHHAQQELGEIVYIQMPQIGQYIEAGQEACVLESTKAAADIYSPVSGTVTEVNLAVSTDPSLINRTPQSTGWLYKIQLTFPEELDTLLSLEQYAGSNLAN